MTGHGDRVYRVGDWVRVRSAREILDTLDQANELSGLPFMPEMLQYCGKTFRIRSSAHKTCDAVGSIRRMEDAVHLDLRCDGSGHDGCQAGCLLFWKTQWLHPADGPDDAAPSAQSSAPEDWAALLATTRSRVPGHYRCQATEILRATSDVRRRDRWNPGLYVRDLTSGNVSVREFVTFGLIAAMNAFTERWFGWRYPRVRGLAKASAPPAELHLQPGELVRVRSKAEILRTLNAERRNRGLWFDGEAVPYCGSSGRVLRRVERLIDEKTGAMIHLKTAAVIIDGMECGGKFSSARMFCPRAIYPYWREAWLERLQSDHSSPKPTV